LIKKLIDEDFNIIGYPRLVRLNPNIPWKTRGNGAISIKFGIGKGKKTKIGEINKKEIFCFKENSSKINNLEKIQCIVEKMIKKYAKLEEKNTNSGFVILKKQPLLEEYKKAVKGIIKLDETIKLLKKNNAFFKGYNNCRGLIGATASVSWTSKKDKTFEIITYRKKDKWGKKRYIDDNSTIIMDNKIKSTFDNFDYKNNHNRLVPNSPCPVLFGIRGEISQDLIKAKSIINSEEIDSWIIFETNQGTDDHLQKTKIDNIKPFQSVIVKGIVIKKPFTIKGGHVIFSIKDSTGKIDCAAYEPTKEFRVIIRELEVNDMVEVYGGVREKPLAINLEKIEIKYLEKIVEKVENPICPKCKKHMKSIGNNKGFKCKKCGIKSNKPIIRERKRNLELGFYETPVCSRRHFSNPLKRLNHKPF
jgi:tRNA(Ile2)-agmatinylcytidine synthase